MQEKRIADLRDMRQGNFSKQVLIDCPFPRPASGKLKSGHLCNFDPLRIANRCSTDGHLQGRFIEDAGDADAHGCHGFHACNQGNDKPIRAKYVDGPRVDREDFPRPGIRAYQLSPCQRCKTTRTPHGNAWHMLFLSIE